MGTGCEDETVGLQPFSVGEFKGVCIHKLGLGTKKGEPPILQLPRPIIRELRDDLFFSLLHRSEIRPGFLILEPKNFSLSSEVQGLGRIDQGFRRHTSAKNTQPPQFIGTVHNRHTSTQFIGRSGRRITGTATSDDNEIMPIEEGTDVFLMSDSKEPGVLAVAGSA